MAGLNFYGLWEKKKNRTRFLKKCRRGVNNSHRVISLLTVLGNNTNTIKIAFRKMQIDKFATKWQYTACNVGRCSAVIRSLHWQHNQLLHNIWSINDLFVCLFVCESKMYNRTIDACWIGRWYSQLWLCKYQYFMYIYLYGNKNMWISYDMDVINTGGKNCH